MDDKLTSLSLTDSLQYFTQLYRLSESVSDYLKTNSVAQWEKVLAVQPSSNKPNINEALIERKKYWELAIIFPNTLYSSIFLSAYSLIENTLISFAKEINNDITPESRTGGIFLAKDEIIKHENIKFPLDDPNWKFIVLCNRVRNCLAHSSGDIDKSKNSIRIREFIAIEPTLAEADGYLFIQKKFVDKFIRSEYDLIENILDLNYSPKNSRHTT